MCHLKIHKQKSCQTVSLRLDTSPYRNFPDELVYPIEFHHEPFPAPEEYASRAYIVCLSDLLTKGHDEGIHFRTIGQDILGLRDLAAQHEIAVSMSEAPGVGFQEITVKQFNRLR